QFSITLFGVSEFDYVLVKKSSALSKSYFLLKSEKIIDKHWLPHYIPPNFCFQSRLGQKASRPFYLKFFKKF
ncbi:MAG: hypothetical protein PVF79_08590, partial [Desulfobacterales bacterium]